MYITYCNSNLLPDCLQFKLQSVQKMSFSVSTMNALLPIWFATDRMTVRTRVTKTNVASMSV